MENTVIWKAVERPPTSALKQIGGGRLRGMTDINPQWRYQVMTEQFGPCGIGWTYEIKEHASVAGHDGEICYFVVVNLFVNIEGQWSRPIPGAGGSKLIEKESAGLRTNDEAFKMALTDALSVAMKQLGVAADIYAGLWDGSKYRDRPAPKQSPSKTETGPSEPTLAELKSQVQTAIRLLDWDRSQASAFKKEVIGDVPQNMFTVGQWKQLAEALTAKANEKHPQPDRALQICSKCKEEGECHEYGGVLICEKCYING